MPRAFNPSMALGRRWLSALVWASLSASVWAQRAPSPTDPKAIIAETQQMARKQGMVRISGVLWKCSDRLCIATSKRASTSVGTCQALAELVGSLSRFGRVERPIPSYDLALCNVRAQIKLAKIEQEQAAAKARLARQSAPKNGAKPLTPPDTVTAAPPAPPAPVAPAPDRAATESPLASRGVPPVIDAMPNLSRPAMTSYRPPLFSMRVSQLSLVGRGNLRALDVNAMTPAPRPAIQQVFAVEPLTLAGLGRLVEAPAGTYLSITVDKLHVVGGTQPELEELR